MPIEILLSIALALVASAVVVPLARTRRVRGALWLAALTGAAGFAALAVDRWLPSVVPAVQDDRPRAVARDGYVTSDTCRACHPRNHATWRDTWHRTMTQVATPGRALGRFDGATVEVAGERYRMWAEDGALWGAIPDPARGPGAERTVPLVLSTGSHHMQVYWYPTGAGRPLGQFPLVWLREAARWVPRNAAFVRPPANHDPEEQGRWNSTCIKCHTTRGRPGLVDLDPLSLRTGIRSEAAELGIACEACHGPGAEHVAANRDPLRRYRLHLDQEAPDPTIVNPARLDPARSAAVCGQCHSVFTAKDRESHIRMLAEGYDFKPGDDLESNRRIVRHGRGSKSATGEVGERERALIPVSFWPDGMVRVSGREYNGLTASPCFANAPPGEAMTCLGCHRLHQDEDDARPPAEWANDLLDTGMRTNAACTGCHTGLADEAASAEHSRHAPGSSGALCYNCHMPPTTFGLLKAMRSHTIDSPDATIAKASGRPLACNLCHLDRSLGWSADRLAEWYGHDLPELAEDEATVPASVVALLAGDAAARALAAWSMAWPPAVEASGDVPLAALLARVLDDPYDAVRYVAARSIAEQPGAPEFDYDFLADADTRRAARARLEASTDALLGVSAETLDRLAARRDDRPVLLVE